MSNSDEIFTVTLSTSTTPEALRAFRAEVVRALDAGTKALLVDIDAVPSLDSPVIAALIVALRSARETSALVSLRVSRTSHLDTLRVTGLDQVFTIVVPFGARSGPAAPKRERRPRRRRIVAVVAATLALAGFSSLGSASPSPVPFSVHAGR